MTVSTTSGVVGVVWKQNDRYYVRGVPVAENGNTIPLWRPQGGLRAAALPAAGRLRGPPGAAATTCSSSPTTRRTRTSCAR